MIFVSTGGRPNKPAWETAMEFAALGINGVELSGGLASDGALAGTLAAAKMVRMQPHNYFPPPKDPFVLNLASCNEAILTQSVAHIQKSIELARLMGAKTYSFHAGYLMDPKPSELGRKVSRRVLDNRQEAVDRFVDRCMKMADFASSKGIRLLVENNVLSHNNYKEFGENPFLMVDIDECVQIMSRLNGKIGLLVDVAHLKVSSKTLGFDRESFMIKSHDWTESYHLSDNNGLTDSNSKISGSSWFWPYLNKDVGDIVIEVYSDDNKDILEQYELVRRLRK